MWEPEYWDYDNEEPEDEYYEFFPDGRICETQKAILYRLEGREIWIPKSVHEVFDDSSIIIDGWFAEKEGLI